jgi:PHP family Zn ribbon phosphoesterase
MHIHTPVSSQCYQQKDVQFIDILRKAEERGLDVIAITDHNSVAGISAFRRRLETLQYLDEQGRLSQAEKGELDEYYHILNKVLVLPGFEFTATLGFHVLAIFPPQTSVRKLEHVLLELNVPEEKLDEGTSEIGATVDVLTAYQTMNRAGALVIAAHANSTHGVAMQNFNFGGQTKISYTQDPNLHALEVTDLASAGRRTTANFYNGTKSEYPRRMHCIQGSDAHRLDRDPGADKNTSLGIGDRPTEMLLEEISFEAIRDILLSDDFSRTRPHMPPDPMDPVKQAQEAGPGLTVGFHERPTVRNRGYEAVLRDIAAFANTDGGTLYIGAGAAKGVVKGLDKSQEVADALASEVGSKLAPAPQVTIEVLDPEKKGVLVLTVPAGAETPYVLEGGQVWVRRGPESVPATRADIVAMVLRSQSPNGAATSPSQPTQSVVTAAAPAVPEPALDGSDAPSPPADTGENEPPRTGVEIVDSELRDGVTYHTVRDLRNGSVVQNVTRFSARRLWRYAITEHESGETDLGAIQWKGHRGLLKAYKRGGQLRYNLAERDREGNLRIYYGVTDDGLQGTWREFAVSPADVVEEQVEEAQREPAPVS